MPENTEYEKFSSGPSATQSRVPDLPRPSDKEFLAAEYQFKSKLINSQFAQAIFDNILDSDFTMQCKLGFFKILTQAFDSNAVLANNQNIEVRKIGLEIVLNEMIHECRESDVQNPAFMTTQENIIQAFGDFVSRSVGGEERARIGKSEQKVTYEGLQGGGQPQQQPIQQPSRGLHFPNFLRRGNP